LPRKRGFREREALQLFALTGPMNPRQVWKTAKKEKRGSEGSLSSYQKAVDLLWQDGYIRVKESAPWYGKRRSKKTYEITTEGLLEALQDEDLWKEIDRLAKAQSKNFPEIFGAWTTYKQMGAVSVATKLLRYSVKRLAAGKPTYPEKLRGRTPTLRDWFVRSSIYPEYGVLSRNEYLKWIDVLLADEGTRNVYLDTIKWMYESHKTSAEFWGKTYQGFVNLTSWAGASHRLKAIVSEVKDPAERLKALKQDRDLSNKIEQIYRTTKESISPRRARRVPVCEGRHNAQEFKPGSKRFWAWLVPVSLI